MDENKNYLIGLINELTEGMVGEPNYIVLNKIKGNINSKNELLNTYEDKRLQDVINAGMSYEINHCVEILNVGEGSGILFQELKKRGFNFQSQYNY